ncbi:MAG: glycosyltransferase family 2 protein [Pseudomonadota bacterium]
MAETRTPRVSIIIPAYRCADTLPAAIESGLAQSAACEVIVVDDASGDDTVAVARAMAARLPGLTVLEQPINQGPAAARNRAILTARGDWIALLDADDRMEPERVENLLALAEAHQWDLVADDLIRVTDWDDPASRRRHWRDDEIGEIDVSLAQFARQNHYDHSGHGRELGYLKPLMNRTFLLDHELWYDESMRLGEDFDLYARALVAEARFGLTDPAGYYAFDTPGSLSRSHRAADLKQIFLSVRRLETQLKPDDDARAPIRALRVLNHKKWAWVRLIEAVRTRNIIEAFQSFVAPPAVIGDLTARLREHFQDSDRRDIDAEA